MKLKSFTYLNVTASISKGSMGDQMCIRDSLSDADVTPDSYRGCRRYL